MAGQGDDGFGNYSLPDPWFSTGYYNPYFDSSLSQAPAAGGRPPLPHGFSGFDLNNYGPSLRSAPAGSGGPNAPAVPYSGYELHAPYFGASTTHPGTAVAMTRPPHGYYQCAPPAGAHSLAEPARHSTSSTAPIQMPPVPGAYGGYGAGSSRAACVDMTPLHPPWASVPMGDDIFASSAPGRRNTQSQTRREAPSPVPVPSSNKESNASEDDDAGLSWGSSQGDNAEIFGTGPSVPAEVVDGDTSRSDLEGIDFEGDSSSVSEDTSSDFEGDSSSVSEDTSSDFEGYSSSVSEDTSSDEEDEERYKELEEEFGKENLVFQGIKIALDSVRRRRKLIKKAIQVMYDVFRVRGHMCV